ncbi:farnesyl pyrophosphate synthase-like [Lutzomyia longipalpis]|uniref:farnesyl pyrophosphate synthase-like n=1 Tax=Lutzomyia longipalpis TaxID=7200 RepID=UPI0024835C95|nr:farnesyl pyrophosphate synthase-like [Lutzomyia longipalpis]
MAHYPSFLNKIKAVVENYDTVVIGKHLERVLNYTVSGGKKNRAKIVVAAYKEIVPKDKLTEENFLLAVYLGWCLEVFHASVLIFDDIMDESLTRRGKPCWHKLPDVQLKAINDSSMMEATIYKFIKKNFNHLPCYENIIDTLHTNILIITVGQYLDMIAMHQDVLTFTMEQYRKTVIHKTADYSIYTPTKLGQILAGSEDCQGEGAKNILYEMGIFLQIQDDFLDCYGDAKVTGKIATDIQDGKCTWLVVTFLQRANRVQKDILKKFYGKKDEESVVRIKQLYEDVGLREAYRTYEDTAYKSIKRAVQETNGIPKKMCEGLMDKIYKRKL